MSKIEVDPKLFITCRLCLDEMGQYQIDPNVQTQIKFCYDIDVDSFDGLPQLICKNCETILTDFNNKKSVYQEKQLALKKNAKSSIISAPLQQQDTVSSTQSALPETNPVPPFKLRLKTPELCNLFEKKQNAKTVRPWRKMYHKYIVCRYCDSMYRNKKKFMKHKETHTACLDKYSHILKHCKIQLPRIDEKTNFVESDDFVVMNEEQVVVNKHNQYRVLYKRNAVRQNRIVSSDSSDDGIVIKTKRLRVLSESSNETVVLEDPPKKENSTPKTPSDKPLNEAVECVDIDSSDTESTFKSEAGNKKIIREIISSCVKKFTNKDSLVANSFKEIQLQHKILSIGRKIVNSKSFNCTGLLRYLEHKNLDIQWNPRTGQDLEMAYVHLRTKLQDSKRDDAETGWKVVSDLKGSDSETYMENLEKILRAKETAIPTAEETSIPKQNTSADATLENDTHKRSSGGVLSKILNTAPVMNPKKLPKSGEATKRTLVPSEDVNQSMPIITSTISLAEETVSHKETADKTTTFVPRIKVKPASQLMAAKDTTTKKPTQIAWTIPETQMPIEQNNSVVMHTVEMPQTKTLSPFKYFQNLLQMHGIILLDTSVQVPIDFVSLIKFKSVFKQETKRVILSLCLLSDSRQFCIKVTDLKSCELDVNTLVPTWQWEILSLYKSDLANNILENAKKIGQKMFESTNYFLSLLRSIVLIKP